MFFFRTDSGRSKTLLPEPEASVTLVITTSSEISFGSEASREICACC